MESLQKFLKWAIDFSNLEFSVTLHSQDDNEKNETDLCYDYRRTHYHLVFYSVTLNLECAIYDADGKTPAEGSIPVCFINDTHHSFFFTCWSFFKTGSWYQPATMLTTTRPFLRRKLPQIWTPKQPGLELRVINTMETKAQQNSISGKKISSRENAQKNSNLLERLTLICLSAKSFCCQRHTALTPS